MQINNQMQKIKKIYETYQITYLANSGLNKNSLQANQLMIHNHGMNRRQAAQEKMTIKR